MNPRLANVPPRKHKLKFKTLRGSDMIFIAGGDGGTCTGAAPSSQNRKDAGALTVAGHETIFF